MLWPIGPVTTELSQGAARPLCRGDRQREDCAPSCPLPTVRSRSSARSRSWSTRGPALYIAKECDEPGVGELKDRGQQYGEQDADGSAARVVASVPARRRRR